MAAGALASAMVLGWPVTPARASNPAFPTFSGAELKAFYYASLPLPGTARITARPAIYGSAAADARIQAHAEARGYRLQATPTGPLGSYGGVTLADDAGRAWLALLDAARRHGTPLQGNSGYRSVTDQRAIFTRRLDAAGRSRIGRPYTMSEIASGAADAAIESVLAYHSIPGYSRHHTGKTLDLSNAGGTNGGFAATAAHRWLTDDNYQVAKAHGFIPSYPPGAGAQGPNPEPWEFVYVGVERIRCAIEVVALADPRAREICGIADVPLVGELTGDAIDDVFVYRPGRSAERLYPGTPTRQLATRSASSVTGRYWPVVGDFDGNGHEDILWYAPGPAPDSLWYHRADGSHATAAAEVNGLYVPVVGDLDGNGADDILWYGTGDIPDSIWFHAPGGGRRSSPTTVNGTTYRPVAGDFDGNGHDDILWYAPGATDDFVWYHAPGVPPRSRVTRIEGAYALATGDHDGDGRDDVAFLAHDGPDSLWFGASPYGFTRVRRDW